MGVIFCVSQVVKSQIGFWVNTPIWGIVLFSEQLRIFDQRCRVEQEKVKQGGSSYVGYLSSFPSIGICGTFEVDEIVRASSL